MVGFFLLLLIIFFILVIFKFLQLIKIGIGYAAKVTCSAVFVSGRTLESVRAEEIANSAASIVSVYIDEKEKSATASFLGIKRKTIYRDGLGCTLLNETKASDLYQTKRIGKNILKDDPLPVAQPENIDWQQLDKAFAYAFDEPVKRNTRAALVIYNGNIIKEQYKAGFDVNTPLLGWSMTKSVTNALAGIMVKQGKLALHQPVNISDWETKANDKRANITLHHLLQMNSGLHFEEEYGRLSTVNQMLWLKPNAAQVAINQKLKYDPGTFWYYSSGTTNIITQLIKNQFSSEQAYLNFPYDAIFEPLGMHSAQIEVDASNNYVGSSFLYATAQDWAKFGLLYLNDGVWNGEQILPEAWVVYSSARNPVSDHGVYSAHFWKNATEPTPDMETNRYWRSLPDDLFYASGFEGQHIMIIPSRDVVIVRLGQTQHRKDWDIGYFTEQVLLALPQ